MDELNEKRFSLHIGRDGAFFIEFDDEAMVQRLSPAEAVILRDWLNKAFPTTAETACGEKHE